MTINKFYSNIFLDLNTVDFSKANNNAQLAIRYQISLKSKLIYDYCNNEFEKSKNFMFRDWILILKSTEIIFLEKLVNGRLYGVKNEKDSIEDITNLAYEIYENVYSKENSEILSERTLESTFYMALTAHIYLLIADEFAKREHYFFAQIALGKSDFFSNSFLFYKGQVYKEIQKKAPKPITLFTNAQKEIILPLAEKIWTYDSENILMMATVADIIIEQIPELISKKENGKNYKLKKEQAREKLKRWFKEEENLVPDGIKKRGSLGAVDSTEKPKRAKLIKIITAEMSEDFIKAREKITKPRNN